jgi:outer membrane protein OmpU
MRNKLLGTTAFMVLGTTIGVANAGDVTTKDTLQLSIGGKIEQYFGGVGAFEDGGREDGFGINTDTEVYFTGKTTLDNGITVAAVIQLEAQTNSSTNADEQYVTVSGSFGKIMAGQKDDAATQLAISAPKEGAMDMLDVYFWLGQPNSGTFAGGLSDWGSDDATVMYFTPSFQGFTGAVSYTPNPGSALVPSQTASRDNLSVTLAYGNEFNGVGIDSDASALFDLSQESWAVRSGLQLSYAGFAVGGSFLTQQGKDNRIKDTYMWDAGVSYETGPYALAFTYAANEGGGAFTGDQQSYKLGATYNMGPGIDLVGNVFYAGMQSPGVNGDRDGVGAVGGIAISF